MNATTEIIGTTPRYVIRDDEENGGKLFLKAWLLNFCMLIQTVDFKVITDGRGSLISLEGGSADVPFDIQRVYYIFGVGEGVVRGAHAHKRLRQVVVCMSGSCRMVLDNGLGVKEDIVLDTPTRGLLISSMTWREMHDFSPDCVLVVLADSHYDESDYYRHYDDFLRAAQAAG
jgi:dTDP-4-dehydrorhamnose 3,5-epimerase-like enzyme